MQEWPQGTPRNKLSLECQGRGEQQSPHAPAACLGARHRYMGRCGLETYAPCLAYCSAVTLFQFLMTLNKDPTFSLLTGRCKLCSWSSLTEINRALTSGSLSFLLCKWKG